MSNKFLSDGVENFITVTRFHNKKETKYPSKLEESSAVRSARHDNHGWISDVLNQSFGGRPNDALIETNFATFAILRWDTDTGKIKYANIQSIWTEHSISNFLASRNQKSIYLRLDFDTDTLGDIFSHPLVHLHVDSHKSPRFMFHVNKSTNLIPDYFDFVYRNFYYQKWISWVKMSLRGNHASEFIVINNFHEQKDFQKLSKKTNELNSIKNIIKNKKPKGFKLKIDKSIDNIYKYF